MTDLGAGIFMHGDSGIFQSAASYRVSGRHCSDTGRDSQDITSQRVEFVIRHFNELDAFGNQQFPKRYRHQTRMHECQIGREWRVNRHRAAFARAAGSRDRLGLPI